MTEAFVREWVELVCRRIGASHLADEFGDRVLARLALGAREYGDDNYLRSALAHLEHEGAEEGEDIAGWALACASRVFHDIERNAINDHRAAAKQERYLRAAGYGVLAWLEMREARSA